MEIENVGVIPVIEDRRTKKVVGIVTDRDLAVKVIAHGRNSDTVVGDVMTPGPQTCRVDDDLQHALDLMAYGQIRRVPVVDEGQRLVGIISMADVALRLKAPDAVANLVERISK